MFEAQKNYMKRLFFLFTGRSTVIYEIPAESKDLGYTSGTGYIHIGFLHKTVLALPEGRRDTFRLGVFAHEMLHQVFTDFRVLESAVSSAKTRAEGSIISLLFNVLEDPYIEYHAPEIIGGVLLKALRFTIRVLYKEAPGIEESVSGFNELVNALIEFGDMGLVKGRFTDDEAFRFFREIAPEFNALIKKSTPEERMDAAVRWMELTRPLWEKEEDPEKTAQELCEQNGISSYAGETRPQEQESGEGSENDENGNETPESRRRDEAAETLSNGIGDEEGEEGDEGDEGEAEQDKRGGYGSVFKDKESAEEIVFEELEITDSDIENVLNDIRKLQEQEKSFETPDIQNLDLDIESKFTGKASCKNIRMIDCSASSEAEYTALVRRNSRQINELTYTLKAIFNRDQDEMIRSQSGKYNIRRGTIGTTTKIFDKKRSREHMDDIAVCMAIDESGSMYAQGKIDVARETAVIFAEVFHRLKIPFYVMGFTADIDQDVVQDHYITWSNTARERRSLVSMRAQANNFDGYSIRYATKVLEKRKAEHKILFVISDGLPACSKYRSLQNGLADTADAIRSAKKTAGVFGLGLGDCRPEVLKKLYQETFTYVKNVNELPGKAIDLFKKIVKTY